MSVILFEDAGYRHLLPLTYWRSSCELRCGRRSLLDHIAEWCAADGVEMWVRPALRAVVERRQRLRVNEPAPAAALLVNGRWLPQGDLGQVPRPSVGMVGEEVAWVMCDPSLAARLSAETMLDEASVREALHGVATFPARGRLLAWPWDLLERGADMLVAEWQAADAGNAGTLHEGAHLLHARHIHVGQKAVVQPGAVLDAEHGPIFIDDEARIGPNAVVEGPSYVGKGSHVHAGAWIRNNVVIGPRCKVGGEVGMSMFQGHANKQHDGFLGHSCIGEWVNLGAGTTTSNLKNTYGSVRVPIGGVPIDSARTFMGSVIGDFARTGIGQALTTGSVIGISSSVVTAGMAAQFVPSFRFVIAGRDEPYDPGRALEVATTIMSRRELHMTPEEREYFQQLPEICLAHEAV